jgi:hypothetical protein
VRKVIGSRRTRVRSPIVFGQQVDVVIGMALPRLIRVLVGHDEADIEQQAPVESYIGCGFNDVDLVGQLLSHEYRVLIEQEELEVFLSVPIGYEYGHAVPYFAVLRLPAPARSNVQVGKFRFDLLHRETPQVQVQVALFKQDEYSKPLFNGE